MNTLNKDDKYDSMYWDFPKIKIIFLPNKKRT